MLDPTQRTTHRPLVILLGAAGQQDRAATAAIRGFVHRAGGRTLRLNPSRSPDRWTLGRVRSASAAVADLSSRDLAAVFELGLVDGTGVPRFAFTRGRASIRVRSLLTTNGESAESIGLAQIEDGVARLMDRVPQDLRDDRTYGMPSLDSRDEPATYVILGARSKEAKSLRSLMQMKGIERIEVPAGDEVGNAPWPIQAALDRAEVVLALVADESDIEATYSIAYGVAKGARVVAVVEPSVRRMLGDFPGVSYVSASIDDREALEFGCEQALAAPRQVRQRPGVRAGRIGSMGGIDARVAHGATTSVERSTSKTRPIGASADRLLQELEALPSELNAGALERLVVRALDRSGITIRAESPNIAGRPDLAVWADELNAWTGNPLLIEIKNSLTNPRAATSAIQRLRSMLQESHARSALLLYVEGPANPIHLPDDPDETILPLKLSEFFGSLRARSFADVVKGLQAKRNEEGLQL